jgi:7-carboxy-7-deazaguanine synthase
MLESGYLTEIFSSIQGEGIYVGQRHTFVRFAGCNIHCAGCDTPGSLTPQPGECIIHTPRGRERYTDNPVTAKSAATLCSRYGDRAVALTGGEPLQQPEFLYHVLYALKNAGHTTYLETNGTLPAAYPMISGMADVVAMDIKLPSFTGLPPMWDEHTAFLRAARHDGVFVKVVVTRETTTEEITTAAGIVSEVGRGIPLVIQPASGLGSVTVESLVAMQDAAMKLLSDVRVIPQIHRTMGIR